MTPKKKRPKLPEFWQNRVALLEEWGMDYALLSEEQVQALAKVQKTRTPLQHPVPAAEPPARPPVKPSPKTPGPPAAAPAAKPPVRPAADKNPQQAQEYLTILRDQEIGDCTRCVLHQQRQTIVFGEGSPAARIMFVGEGPGADEDRQGRPFVGKAGQLLTKIITGGMGLQREEVYIANVVKCRPPGNRDPEPAEVDACMGFLVKQIEIIDPEVVVALGRHAAHTLLGVKTPITRLRGEFQPWRGRMLMPTFHPSYLLRNPAAKKEVWADIKAVLQYLGMPIPSR